MVFRIYVEKKPELAHEANTLCSDIKNLLGLKNLGNIRILNRYDVDRIDEQLFNYAKDTVFSEPQLDIVTDDINNNADDAVFAVEYLPGQFDQRADSAAQCIQIISQKERPLVRTAKVYILSGSLTSEEVDRIKKYGINPVASL